MQNARTKAAFQKKEQGAARANGHTPMVAVSAASGAKPPAAVAQQSPRTEATLASQHGSRAAAPASSSLRHSAAAQHAGQPAPRAAPAAPPVKQPNSVGRPDTRPDYLAKRGAAGNVLTKESFLAQQPGSAPAGDSSPDYSAAPKAKAAGAAPSTSRAQLPDRAPAGDGSPDYSARTGQGVRARPGSTAAAACGSCTDTATAVTALAQDMRGLQAVSRQMLQEVISEMHGLRDRSASLEGHVRQLSAEVARLAELYQGNGAPNGEHSQANDLMFLSLLTHPACL